MSDQKETAVSPPVGRLPLWVDESPLSPSALEIGNRAKYPVDGKVVIRNADGGVLAVISNPSGSDGEAGRLERVAVATEIVRLANLGAMFDPDIHLG